MPFKSESQRRLFHALADRGEIGKKTVKEWEDKTKNKEDLPMHADHEKNSFYEVGVKLAMEETGFIVKSAGGGDNAWAPAAAGLIPGIGPLMSLGTAAATAPKGKEWPAVGGTFLGGLTGGTLGHFAGSHLGGGRVLPTVLGMMLGGAAGSGLGYRAAVG